MLDNFRLNNIEPRHEISNNVVCATSKGSDQPAHTRSLIRAFASRLDILSVKLTEHHLEFLSLKGSCRGSSENATLLEITCHGSYVLISCSPRKQLFKKFTALKTLCFTRRFK